MQLSGEVCPARARPPSWSPGLKGEQAEESSESCRGRRKIRSVDFCGGKGLLLELEVISPLFFPMCAETWLPPALRSVI